MNKIKEKLFSLPKVKLIPILVAGLVIAGVATAAAYNFFTATATVTVDEAIIMSMGAANDKSPYMSSEGVLPNIELGGGGATITISAGVDDGSEFVAGETLVIPVNLRNRSDEALPLSIVASGISEGLDVKFVIEKAGYWQSDWENSVDYTIAGHEGAFGSADDGATILFAKVHALNNCPTGGKTFTVLFSRGE